MRSPMENEVRAIYVSFTMLGAMFSGRGAEHWSLPVVAHSVR